MERVVAPYIPYEKTLYFKLKCSKGFSRVSIFCNCHNAYARDCPKYIPTSLQNDTMA